MNIYLDWITGCMVGIELFNDPIEGRGLIIDLVIFRLVFDWSEV